MTFPLFDLAGLRALVTGSSQGIGFALARGLAEHGAEVVLNGRNQRKLDVAVRELADIGVRVSASDFDVTDADAVKRGVDAIEGSTGPIDILINNAGMQFRGPLEEFPVDRWEGLLKTNISSAFYVGQAVARHMIAAAAQNRQHRLGTERTRSPRDRALYGNQGRCEKSDPWHGDGLGKIRSANQRVGARLFQHAA